MHYYVWEIDQDSKDRDKSVVDLSRRSLLASVTVARIWVGVAVTYIKFRRLNDDASFSVSITIDKWEVIR